MRRLLSAALLLGALLVVAVLADVVVARPVLAHASLVATTPGEGARLPSAPAAVTLEFNEGVSLAAGYARVLGADGERVDAGAAAVSDGAVTIPLRTDLPDASYVVTYRVLSADAHPIAGAYAFVVGDGELVPAGAAVTGDAVDPVVGVALPIARWLGFAGLALAVGLPVFLLLCWPAGWAVLRLRRLSSVGLAGVAVGGLLTVLLHGPYAAGSGPSTLVDPALLASTASSAFGATVLARVMLALALAAVLLPAFGRSGPPARSRVVVGGLLAAMLVLSVAGVGHPVAGGLPVVAVGVSAVHVAAMALWLGGLAALAFGLLRPASAALDLAAAVPRYSRLAFGAVLALVVTGIVQSVREVGSPVALVSTAYGWLLVAKLALVLLLLGVAGVSRVWVQQHYGLVGPRPGARRRVTAHAFAARSDGDTSDGDTSEGAARVRAEARARAAVEDVARLRRSVLIEVAVAAVVLALSAVLVGTPPARAVVVEPVDVTLPLQGAGASGSSVQLSVDPARPGANTLHVYLFDGTGKLTQPIDIRVTLTEAQQQIGPLELDLEPAGAGHYSVYGMAIPTAGTWTLTAVVRLDEFTATTASADFPVR